MTGKGGQEGWMLFKKARSRAFRVCPHVLKDELSWEMTGLSEQRAQEEKEGPRPLGEGVGHSGGLQRCREAVQGQN